MSLRAHSRPLALAAIVLVVTSLPYVVAYLGEPSGHVFMGFFVNGDDMNSYLEKMREGLDGQWVWTNRYTTEAAPPVYLFTWALALGHLAGLLHLNLTAMLQVFRITGAFALFLAAWSFLREFLADPRARVFAMYLLAFTMGFGFVLLLLHRPVILGQRTDALDIRMPELSGIYSVLAGFAWPGALVAAGAVLSFRAAESARFGPAVGGAVAWLGEASIHPQVLVLVYAALVLSVVVRPVSRRGYAVLGVSLFPSLPYVAYAYWLSKTSTEVRLWQAQGANSFVPDAVSFSLAILPLAVLAVFSAADRLRTRSRQDVFLVTWIVLVVAVMWVPGPAATYARRFLDGVYVPLACLAADGLYRIVLPNLGARGRRLLPFAYVAISAITPAFLVLGLTGTARSSEFALTRSQYDAISWLADQPAGVVLSSARLGLYVPAYTDDTVFVGNYAETYRYKRKSALAASLLRGEGDLPGFVRANRVRYVLWSAADSTAPPGDLGSPVFYAPGVAVFEPRT